MARGGVRNARREAPAAILCRLGRAQRPAAVDVLSYSVIKVVLTIECSLCDGVLLMLECVFGVDFEG